MHVYTFLTVTFCLWLSVSAQCSGFTSNITTYIVNPTSCSAWIACSEGNVVNIGTCATGYLYNSETQSCAIASTVKCPVTEVLNICQGLNHTTVANPANCNGYFYCIDGVGSAGLCRTGFVFNATAKVCVNQPDYDCPTMTSTDSTNSSSMCNDIPDGTIFSSAGDNSACYVCYNEQPVPSSCSKTTPIDITKPVYTSSVMNNILLDSTLPDSYASIDISVSYNYTSICAETSTTAHFASDPGDCTGYFYCRSTDDSSPHHGYCPNGLYFDFANQHCTNSSSANCNLLPCLGKPVGYFDADGASCEGFYYCSATGPTKGNCKTGYSFDVANQKCRRKEVLNCTIA